MSVATIEHGLYEGLDENVYHADLGSLSHSGAKLILEAPARFQWVREHGQEPRRTWDFGRAAHAHVLGVMDHIVVRDFPDYRAKKAQDWRDEVRANGDTPMLTVEWEVVEEMATALRAHHDASKLLDPESGRPEVSMFWLDEPTGITRRARLDWLPWSTGRRMHASDYKTAVSANPADFGKAAANYGYHSQADWYCDGIRALCGEEDPAFLFIVQEKTPPYLVSVCELDEEARAVGALRNREAINRFVECSTSGVWPSYPTQLVSLPRWATFNYQEGSF